MIYGKKFRKLQELYPQFNNLSANRCSQLKRTELMSIAKTLYSNHKNAIGSNYMRQKTARLATSVYNALTEL